MPARLKILVVDDDLLTLEMIGSTLTAEGVDVLGLRDAREASALIQKQIFDGIFLDLTMPGLNGIELTGLIRSSIHNATTPVVVITGREDTAAMKEAFSAGAHFFLSKPLDVAKLRCLIRSTSGTLLRERRRNRLVSLSVAVSCRAGSRSFAGTTSQISEQGLICRLDDSPRTGELVQLDFCLPSSAKAIEVLSMIVRTDDRHSTACQFKDLAGAAREAVQGFVASVADLT
jgi:DNA-binding response OmpR family regulator